jgi:DNA-binding PadR family transcriptional regulator
MTVRHSLLAILTAGDAYGYQLRQEFNRRTGAVWPLNVGQVYTTLDRLVRDGLVEQREADAEGHVRFRITAAGKAEVERWFATPVVRDERDELAVKVALATSLPGIDTAAVVAAQRSGAADAQPGVIGAWLAAMAEAEARWLDVVAAGEHEAVGLADEVPKRGRPARTQP